MSTEDGKPHPDVQICIMNARCIAHIAQERDRWKLAGDNLFVDMDLRPENLPVGQRLEGVLGEVLHQRASIAFRKRFRPRCSQVMTVPMGTSRVSAICW